MGLWENLSVNFKEYGLLSVAMGKRSWAIVRFFSFNTLPNLRSKVDWNPYLSA